MHSVEKYFESKKTAYLDTLSSLVSIDSHSDDFEGIHNVALFCQDFLSSYPQIDTTIIRHANGRPFFKAFLPGNETKILILGHMDTVFPKGTAKKRPFYMDEKQAYGPGCADMKAGLCSALYLMSFVAQQSELDFPSVTLFFNSDEESGSLDSSETIESLAKKHDIVLVFEPGRSNGDLVSARKGIGDYRITTHGISAHAGTNHQDGANAIVEMAHKIIALSNLTNYDTGTTINIGKISGGSVTNVVPDFAEIAIDVRFAQLNEVATTEQKIQEIVAHSYDPRVTAKLDGKVNRPPMEETKATLALYRQYEAIAREMNYSIGKQFVGGGSDGNITGALGIPTLDGLGPCGAGFHSESEYIILDSIVPRLTVAYLFMQKLSDFSI